MYIHTQGNPNGFFLLVSRIRECVRTQTQGLDSICSYRLRRHPAEAEGWNKIEDYGNAQIDWLKKFCTSRRNTLTRPRSIG